MQKSDGMLQNVLIKCGLQFCMPIFGSQRSESALTSLYLSFLPPVPGITASQEGKEESDQGFSVSGG